MRSRLGWVGEGGRGVQQDEFRRQAYGMGWAAAEELKQDFNTYKHVLTEEEAEIIRYLPLVLYTVIVSLFVPSPITQPFFELET